MNVSGRPSVPIGAGHPVERCFSDDDGFGWGVSVKGGLRIAPCFGFSNARRNLFREENRIPLVRACCFLESESRRPSLGRLRNLQLRNRHCEQIGRTRARFRVSDDALLIGGGDRAADEKDVREALIHFLDRRRRGRYDHELGADTTGHCLLKDLCASSIRLDCENQIHTLNRGDTAAVRLLARQSTPEVLPVEFVTIGTVRSILQFSALLTVVAPQALRHRFCSI
jgi:hypothetical protein